MDFNYSSNRPVGKYYTPKRKFPKVNRRNYESDDHENDSEDGGLESEVKKDD